jgi:hypothetical protein
VNEFGDGAWSGIGQADDDSVRKNNFNGSVGRVGDRDGNEGRFGLRIVRWSIGSSMFLDPTVKGAGGTTNFTSDLGDGSARMKDTMEGIVSNFRIVVGTGHEGRNEKATRRADRRRKIIPTIDRYARMRLLEQLLYANTTRFQFFWQSPPPAIFWILVFRPHCQSLLPYSKPSVRYAPNGISNYNVTEFRQSHGK